MREGWIRPGSLDRIPAILLDADVRRIHSQFESQPATAQGGWGLHSGDKYLRSLAIIENDEIVEAPAIVLNGTETGLQILDGRHRLQALLDLGHTAIQIAVLETEACKIAEMLQKPGTTGGDTIGA